MPEIRQLKTATQNSVKTSDIINHLQPPQSTLIPTLALATQVPEFLNDTASALALAFWAPDDGQCIVIHSISGANWPVKVITDPAATGRS